MYTLQDYITSNEIDEFIIRKNVKSVNKDNIYDYYDEDLDSNPNVFFLFESIYHDAFSHWIYEGGIFLPFVTQFSDCKILMNKNPSRQYKSAFCKCIGIEDKIEYYDNPLQHNCTYSYINIPKNNICIICNVSLLISLNDNIQSKNELYLKRILTLKTYIEEKHHISYKKTIDNLFLPRNKVENYVPNDRIIQYEHIYDILKNQEYTTYDTMNTVNFTDQVKLLASAKNIYLDYGSSYWVNSLFCKDSHIYVSGIIQHQLEHQCFKILYDIITKSNTITYLTNLP